MNETTDVKPTIKALSLWVKNYLESANIKELSVEKAPAFSRLEALSLDLKDPDCKTPFIALCAELIPVAARLDRKLEENLRIILAANVAEKYLRIRMFMALEMYKIKEDRKLSNNEVAFAQQTIKSHDVSTLYVELTKYIYSFATSIEEYNLVQRLEELNKEHFEPKQDLLSRVGETFSSFVDKLPTFPRSRPSTPVQSSEMAVVEQRDPLAPVVEVSDVIVKPKRNARKKKETAEIGVPDHERQEQERLAKEAEAAAEKLAREQAAKVEREMEAKRQEEIEQQEREKQAAREAELAQQKVAEAAAKKIAQEKAQKEREEKARIKKEREEIERQERAKQAAIEAELAQQKAIEAKKQEEAARQVKEMQDREAQVRQREQDQQIKRNRLEAAKEEKEGIPREIGTLSNLIQAAQQGYSLATAQLIEQRRRENFWPWQRKAVKSLEPDYVKENAEGQQKKLDAIIQRGLYSFEIFRTILFFGALFNLRKEKFTNHFEVCKQASHVQAELGKVAEGRKTIVNKGYVGLHVDDRLTDVFDNALKSIEHKSGSIKGCRQKLGELTQEIEGLEAELLPARLVQPAVQLQVQASTSNQLPRLRSVSFTK